MAAFLETTYANPLIVEPWADPALAGPDAEGWYWCYATDDEHEPPPARRFKVARSRDLVRWQTHPPGAEAGAIPAPIPNAGRFRACWAPDIRRLGPCDWVLYGSLKFDDHTEDAGHGIFAAHASGPLGFADPVILARGRGFTTIDPCFFRDPATGRSFLYWGSSDAGILGRELRADGLAFAPGSTPRQILATTPENHLWEGVHVIERPGHGTPILLVSGVCTWQGPYRVHAFEGGPHPLDRARPVPRGSLLLRENESWNRCGQVFVQRDAIGQDWLFYHAVRGEAVIPGTEAIANTAGRPGIPLRQLCMDRLLFDAEGWPFIEGGSPSSGPRPGPVVRAP